LEILDASQYEEYEKFAEGHRNNFFTQSASWAKVKSSWGHEIVVSRDSSGAIKGGMLILIKKLPVIGASFLYAPRGPVCDFDDDEVLKDLLQGAKAVAKKHHGFSFKMDPIIEQNEQEPIDRLTALGFRFVPGKKYGETVQPRGNYILEDIAGKTPEDLLMHFTQKTRYNVRVAQKHQVECRICGPEAVDDFFRLFVVTAKRDGFTNAIRPKSYYVNTVEAYPDNARFFICYYEGKAISAALCIRYGGKAYYLFGASDNEGRQYMPNYLMQFEMMKWALEGGCHKYDFLGTPAEEETDSPMYGVYRFKKGFNGRSVFYAGEFDYVFNPAVHFLAGTAENAVLAFRQLKRKLRKHRS